VFRQIQGGQTVPFPTQLDTSLETKLHAHVQGKRLMRVKQAIIPVEDRVAGKPRAGIATWLQSVSNLHAIDKPF